MVSKAFLQSKGQVMVKGCWETELLDGLSSVGGSWRLHRGSVTRGCRHSGAAPKWHFTSRSATLLKQPDWPSFHVEIFIGGNVFIVWVYYSVQRRWERLSMWKKAIEGQCGIDWLIQIHTVRIYAPYTTQGWVGNMSCSATKTLQFPLRSYIHA